jgi:hypothetical protein
MSTTVYHIPTPFMRVFTETPQTQARVPARPTSETGSLIKIVEARADTRGSGNSAP